MLELMVSGNSPALPSQKEWPHRAMESAGMVRKGFVGMCSWTRSVWESSMSMTHGLSWSRCSVNEDQSRSLSQALRTVGKPPVDGVIMSSVGVGIKGLWGYSGSPYISPGNLERLSQAESRTRLAVQQQAQQPEAQEVLGREGRLSLGKLLMMRKRERERREQEARRAASHPVESEVPRARQRVGTPEGTQYYRQRQ